MIPWVFAAVLILAVLHQDVWLWGDRDLLGCVVPVGLARSTYNRLISPRGSLAFRMKFGVQKGSLAFRKMWAF